MKRLIIAAPALFLSGCLLNGDDGKDGPLTLTNLTTLAAGPQCANGGQLIESGLDKNGNGLLDTDEVQESEVLCDDNPATPLDLSLEFAGRYQSGVYGESAAEITAYHAKSQRAFVVNAQQGAVDVLDLSNIAAPSYLQTLTVTDILPGAVVNSITLEGDRMAFAIEAATKTDPGTVILYDAQTLERISQVEVGAQPDMLLFTPNGRFLLVANEGEPSDNYQIDPEGSVSVIDLNDEKNPTVHTADFRAWNGKEDELRKNGVRIFGPNATAAQDLEPEFIAISANSLTAYVALQENNALAKLDIVTATITDIFPLGYKDHGLEANGFGSSNALDASDTPKKLEIRTFPGLLGMYQPDAIAAYEVNGRTYIVTANEGDARAWGEDNKAYFGDEDNGGDSTQGFVEEIRVKHLINGDGWGGRRGDDLPPQLDALANGAFLNPDIFAYCGAIAGDPKTCRDDEVLGRLTVTWTLGYQKNADGTAKMYNATGVEDPAGDRLMYDALYSFGARSMAIFNDQGEIVWDSGDQIEQHLASDHCMAGAARYIPCKDYFNSNHSAGNSMDNRSDNKGPEPEGVALGKLGDKTYAFLGLERMGGIMAFDITDPYNPSFVDYLNPRENWTDKPADVLASVGDLGPEGITFIPAAQSPSGGPLLLIGNEVSGTTTVYRILPRYAHPE